MNSRFLQGKHAVVTGGARGIGAAISAELARLGANLTLLGRDQSSLEKERRHLHAEFKVEVFTDPCDVSDEVSVRQAFQNARDAQGEVHVLVNNAGQSHASDLVSTSLTDWQRMLDVNLTGTFLCSREVLPEMRRAGAGRIINIASTAGLKGYTKVSAYTAAKHGVIGLTRSLALEVVKHGVTVNAVCPGYTEGEMAEHAIENIMSGGKTRAEAEQIILRNSPRGKLITPQEVSATVAWLCSPEAGAITGQAIVVAAGEVM